MVTLKCHDIALALEPITLMSHLLTGTKFSDFATFIFSVPWFRGSIHISFHSVKDYRLMSSLLKYS